MYKLNISLIGVEGQFCFKSADTKPTFQIYSGPSGKFKAHVDTPRGATQFASLVVCLPHSHQGGTLRVAHGGQDLKWNWGSESPNTIEWAAFYSDCEHEIMGGNSDHVCI